MQKKRALIWMSIMLPLALSPIGYAQTEKSKFQFTGTDSKVEVKKILQKPVVRGSKVFKTYCTLCHGERGDGIARAAKLYNNINLGIISTNKDYLENIVRNGGAAEGKSPFMPRWQEELSDEQIYSVIDYLTIVRNPEARGKVVFSTNCILCHGIRGNGKGRASVLFDPPPANLTLSDKNDDYKRMIIRYGGAAMGRSDKMPIWGNQLSDQEIEDVVVYLRTILVDTQGARDSSEID